MIIMCILVTIRPTDVVCKFEYLCTRGGVMDLEGIIGLLGIAFLAVTTRIGWLIIGLLAIGGGLIYGYTSHQVNYTLVNHGNVEPLFVSGGTDYFHVVHTPTYYLVDEQSFTPTFSGQAFSSVCAGGMDIFAETNGQSLDVTLTNDGKDTEYQGTSFKVVAIDCFDPSGQPTQQFLTSEYQQHPAGFREDHWPIAQIAIYCGIGIAIVAALTLMIPALWGAIFGR